MQAQPPPVAPGTLRLWHSPTSRSTRVLWLYRELEARYPDELPALDVLPFTGGSYASGWASRTARHAFRATTVTAWDAIHSRRSPHRFSSRTSTLQPSVPVASPLVCAKCPRQPSRSGSLT